MQNWRNKKWKNAHTTMEKNAEISKANTMDKTAKNVNT